MQLALYFISIVTCINRCTSSEIKIEKSSETFVIIMYKIDILIDPFNMYVWIMTNLGKYYIVSKDISIGITNF